MNLIEMLRLRDQGDGRATGASGPSLGPRVFGGHVFAQALLAASASEPKGRAVHSVHGHFLRAGSLDESIEYQVESLTDGRSFSSRQVTARQSSGAIFTATASFQVAETGPMHAAAPRPHLAVEPARRAFADWIAAQDERTAPRWIRRLTDRPVELVPLDPEATFGVGRASPEGGWWMRMKDRCEQPPEMHRALLAYASDMMFLRTAWLPHGVRPGSGGVKTASLDHTIWFHETPDMNRWLVFLTDSPWAGHARGLNHGHFFDESGRMIATVMQESLMRPQGAPPAAATKEKMP